MASRYPNAIDGYAQIPLMIDDVSEVDALSINNLRDAIIKIEIESGLKPSGTYATVAARIDALEAGIGSGPVISNADLQILYGNGNTISLVDTAGDLIITLDSTGTPADFIILDAAGNYLVTDAANNSLDLGSNAHVVDFVGSAGVTSTGNGPWNFGTGSLTFGGNIIVNGVATYTGDVTFNDLLTADVLRYPESSDPVNQANTGFLYTKDDGGDTELFYIDDGGTVTQITKDGSLYSPALAGFTDLNAAENIAAGDALYLTTSGTLGIADNTTAGKTEVVGFAAAAVTSGNPVSLLCVQGIPVTVKTDISASTEGDIVYLGTSGDVTTTIPYNQLIFRVGRVINAGTGAGDGRIMFCPQHFRAYGNSHWVGTVNQTTLETETDYFDDGSVAGKWTSWNVAGDHSATESTSYGLSLTAISSGDDNYGGLLQALPVDNFIVATCQVKIAGRGQNNTIITGMVVGEDLITNPSTASFFSIQHNLNSGYTGHVIELTKYTNYTTNSGVVIAIMTSPVSHVGYFRFYIDRVAGAVTPMVSEDGSIWIDLNTLALDATVSSFDTIGIHCLNLSSGVNCYLLSNMFRLDITNDRFIPVGSWI